MDLLLLRIQSQQRKLITSLKNVVGTSMISKCPTDQLGPVLSPWMSNSVQLNLGVKSFRDEIKVPLDNGVTVSVCE